MQSQPIHSSRRRQSAGLALLGLTLIMVMACGSLGNVTSVISGVGTAASAGATAGSGATTAAHNGASLSTAKCQTIGDAYIDFSGEYVWLGLLGRDGAYAANTPDSPTFVNIPKLRTDMDTLSTLPDGTVGATGAAITQFRQLIDQVDANFKSGGKPFSNGSGDGQKVMDLYLKLAVPYTIVGQAFTSACPNYAVATAAPNKASFQIGQTASVGDLRVTLVKVVQPSAGTGVLPQAGNRFLLMYVTITNTGQTALTISPVSETSLNDAAGKAYGFDMAANEMTTVAADGSLDTQIAAGASHSGVVGYQLPTNAGDLLWIFQDFGSNKAIFAVKASDVDTSGASSAPTEDALRASAGATGTELMNMLATADAANMTATATP